MYQILGGIIGLLSVILIYTSYRLRKWNNWLDINFPFMGEDEVRSLCNKSVELYYENLYKEKEK